MKSNSKLKFLCLLSSTLFAAASSQALIVYYGLAKTVNYTQTSDAAPGIEDNAYFQAFVGANTIGDLLTGFVTFTDSTTQNFYADENQNYLNYYSPPSATLADLETAYPSGLYGLDVTGGAESPNSVVMNFPSSDFTTDVPSLTGSSWSSLQLCAPGDDRLVTFGPYINGGFAAITETAIAVVDLTSTDLSTFGYGPSATYTSETILGTELKSGHRYSTQITTNSYTVTAGAGMGGADEYSEFIKGTYSQFRTDTLPGTVAGVITYNDAYTLPFEPLHVEVVGAGGVIEDSQDVYVGYYGYYAFDTNVTGVKSIRFKGRHWISTLIADVDLGVGQPDIDVSLRNGDIDGDNEVTNADYAEWAANNGTFVTPNTSGDLDGDGEVTNSDYAIWAANNGESGD